LTACTGQLRIRVGVHFGAVRAEGESPALAARIAWLARDDSDLKGIPGRQRLWRAA